MSATKTARRRVAMTPAMRQRLQQLLDQQTRDVTEADLLRQAIREYLDRQEDVTGSRAHFRKTLQPRRVINRLVVRPSKRIKRQLRRSDD